jgi:hypothetical protein
MASPFEYVRDRAADEIKYASSTVSQNARTIGIGLVLVVYSLVIAGDKTGLVQQHRIELALAGLCGVLCVALDYLQYYFVIWENRSITGTLRAEKVAILALERSNPQAAQARAMRLRQNLDFLRSRNPWSKRREYCFHAKFAVAMLGVLIVAVMIVRVVLGGAEPVASIG